MKKLIIAIIVALALSTAFAVPVSASQPNTPGVFGKAVSDIAQSTERGLSGTIHDLQEIANWLGIPVGELINS